MVVIYGFYGKQTQENYMVFIVATTLYKFYWDIMNDWWVIELIIFFYCALASRRNRLTRLRSVYNTVGVYFSAGMCLSSLYARRRNRQQQLP